MFLVLLCLVLGCSGDRGAGVEFPSAVESVKSPDGSYRVANLDFDTSDPDEPNHRLDLVGPTADTRLELLRYDRHVEVLWSSDSRRLLITDFESSDTATTLIVTIVPSTVDKRNLWPELLRDRRFRKRMEGNHHVYLQGMRWIGNQTVLLKFWGYGDLYPQGFEECLTYSLGQGFKRAVQGNPH